MSNIALVSPATGTATFSITAPSGTSTDRTLTLPDTTAPILAGSGITLSASAPANTLVTTDAGNVGIGTSSPANKLTVAGAEKNISVLNTSAGTNASPSFSGVRFYGFGETQDGWVAGVEGGNTQSDGYSGVLRFLTRANTAGVNPVERARIDSSGNLLVGTTSTSPNPGVSITPAGNITAGNSAGGSGFEFHTFRRSGTQIGSITQSGTTAVAYNTSSDYRLKEYIAPMTGALAKVAALKPCTYKWKVDGSDGQGFIAHELQEICPDAVTGEKDGVETYTDEDGVEQTLPRYQGIDTSFLVATLTAAIQELNAKVDAQAAEIAALKGQA